MSTENKNDVILDDGTNDYKSIPDHIEEFRDELIRDLAGYGSIKKKVLIDNIVSFVSLSGGAGASTIVANLATILNKRGLSVLIIDTNFMYPVQYSFFNFKQSIDSNRKDLYTYLIGESDIGDSINYYNNSFGVMYADNRNAINFIDTDSKECSKNFEDLIDRVSNLFDIVFIDASVRVEYDVLNTALYKSNLIYTVLDENVNGIANYQRFKNALQSVFGIGGDDIQTIMNKRTGIVYPNIFKKLGIEILKILPFDSAIAESGLAGELFCLKGSSYSKTSAMFNAIMEELADIVLKKSGYNKKLKQLVFEEEYSDLNNNDRVEERR